MKRLIVILLCGVLAPLTSVWGQGTDTLRTVEMAEIVVRSERSLRDIGVQKSLISEATLKETLSASMAEVLARNSTIFIKSSVARPSLRPHCEVQPPHTPR